MRHLQNQNFFLKRKNDIWHVFKSSCQHYNLHVLQNNFLKVYLQSCFFDLLFSFVVLVMTQTSSRIPEEHLRSDHTHLIPREGE